MDIRITVQPDRARRLRGLRSMARGEWDTFVRLLGVLFVLGAIFMVFGAPWLNRVMKTPHGADTGPVVGWILLAVLGILLMVQVELRARWSLVRQPISVAEPVRYAFTAAAVATDSRLHRDVRDWSLIVRAVDTGTDLLLYCDARRAMLVPKEEFTAEQYAELTAFLAARSLLRTA